MKEETIKAIFPWMVRRAAQCFPALDIGEVEESVNWGLASAHNYFQEGRSPYGHWLRWCGWRHAVKDLLDKAKAMVRWPRHMEEWQHPPVTDDLDDRFAFLLSMVPAEERALLLMRFEGEMTYAEIGAKIGVTGERIRQRIKGALALLEKKMGGEA